MMRANKIVKKLMPTNIRYYACQHKDFWGQTGARKWLLQELSERQGDGMESQGDTKMRQDFAKSLKVQDFGSNCHWQAYKITLFQNPFTVNLENVKNATFCQTCY